MLPQEIDQAVQALMARYQLYTQAVRGEYALALAHDFPSSAKTRSEYVVGVTRAITEILPTVTQALSLTVDNIIVRALSDAQSTETIESLGLGDIVANIKGDLLFTLTHCMSSDMRKGLNQLRLTGFDRRLSRAARANPVIEFKQRDGAGRGINSISFVGLEVRHYLLRLYVEVYLLAAQAAGVDRFVVKKDDEALGMFTLSGEGDTQTYHDIRDSVFHPNSRSYPVGVL